MPPPVSIIIGACGDKMVDYWIRQGKDEGSVLVPIVTEDVVYLNLRVETPKRTKFKPNLLVRSCPSHVFLEPQYVNPVYTVYQTTLQLKPNSFLILKIYEMPTGFKISGSYEINRIERDGFTTGQLHRFSAELEPKDNGWQTINVRHSGID